MFGKNLLLSFVYLVKFSLFLVKCWPNVFQGPAIRLTTMPLSTEIQVRYAQSMPISSSTGHFLQAHKVVCYYYAVEAWYRVNRGMFLPEDIDPHLCSHIHYAYATLNPETFVLEPGDKWAEIDNKFYQRVLDLKNENPNLKVIISLGGWAEASEKFSNLVADAVNRKKFISSAVNFLMLHGFDGLDLAWFYPVCWNGECESEFASASNMDDLINYGIFLRELRDTLKRFEPPFIVSATVAGDTKVAGQSYDFNSLARLDYINVMSFDYAAAWHRTTGLHAPLYRQNEGSSVGSVNDTITFYLKKGIPSWKLILGIPAFGRTFSLSNFDHHGLHSPVKGAGIKGEFTMADGLLAFYEICDRIQRQNWKLEKANGSEFYAYYGDQWVSFDHPFSVMEKSDYVKKLQLGGVMIWDIDRDDFLGTCYTKKFPLLTASYAILKGDFTGTPRVASTRRIFLRPKSLKSKLASSKLDH